MEQWQIKENFGKIQIFARKRSEINSRNSTDGTKKEKKDEIRLIIRLNYIRFGKWFVKLRNMADKYILTQEIQKFKKIFFIVFIEIITDIRW